MPASLTVREIPLERIRPGPEQPRRRFEPAALAELAESLKESGVLQPVVVRHRGADYELLAGERRWRAAQLAGLVSLPAVVRDDLDDHAARILGLVENLQRESLSPMETARGLKRLAELDGLTHEAVGQRIGKSREYVSNFLRLLALDAAVQQALDEGVLSLGHAKVLAGLPAMAQRPWLQRVLQHGLSVRQLERAISAERAGAVSPARAPKPADWRRLEQRLSDVLATPVSVEADARGRGELRIRFHSLEAFDGLLQRLGLSEAGE
jgi:ParB family chromosome partitioning protein